MEFVDKRNTMCDLEVGDIIVTYHGENYLIVKGELDGDCPFAILNLDDLHVEDAWGSIENLLNDRSLEIKEIIKSSRIKLIVE